MPSSYWRYRSGGWANPVMSPGWSVHFARDESAWTTGAGYVLDRGELARLKAEVVAVAGPIDAHPLREDPISAGAMQTVAVGDRTLLALSDGFLRIPSNFVGTPSHPTAAYDALAAEYGQVRLPLGCFVLPGEKNTLIDTGFGPYDFRGLGQMVGGRLLDNLTKQGLRPLDIEVISLSHLHSDHVGWIADAEGDPVFPNAVVHIGREDWEYFVTTGQGSSPPAHITYGLLALAERGQVELIDGERQIAPGLTRMPAPGHTPGHSIYVVHDRTDRVLLFGDAMYCPHQLTNSDWSAASDVDPALAARTRNRYVRDLESNGGDALGCHFPELIAGRLLARRDP